MTHEIKVGQRFKKSVGDYKFRGTVVSVFDKLDGKPRFVGENAGGMLFIFAPGQVQFLADGEVEFQTPEQFLSSFETDDERNELVLRYESAEVSGLFDHEPPMQCTNGDIKPRRCLHCSAWIVLPYDGPDCCILCASGLDKTLVQYIKLVRAEIAIDISEAFLNLSLENRSDVKRLYEKAVDAGFLADTPPSLFASNATHEASKCPHCTAWKFVVIDYQVCAVCNAGQDVIMIDYIKARKKALEQRT